MKAVLFALLSLFFSQAFSGACYDCKIESIGTGPNYDRICPSGSCAFIRINSSGGTFTRHACSTSNDWHYVLDTSTTSGTTSLSQLLTAFTANKTVAVGGGNACTVTTGSASENFDFIYFSW